MYPSTLFTKAILGAEFAIMDMGQDPKVAQAWSLSGKPIEVMIGADIECYLREKETGLKISEVSSKKRKSLLSAIYNACGPQLCNRPFVDSDSVELNPIHGNPSFIIKNYSLLDQKIHSLAESRGWDFAMGAGHWHLSLKDPKRIKEGIYILNSKQEKSEPAYAPFAEKLSENLVNLARLVPALFLRPSRSEKPAEAPFPNTRELTQGETRRGMIQMNGSQYPCKARMYEVRMAHLAPITPVLLLLHATARTFWEKPIEIENYNKESVSLEKGDIFIRGPEAFLKDLETTRDSGYLDRHFPDLKTPWMKACIDSYRRYLTTPSWSASYTPETREKALRRLEQNFAAPS